MFCVFLILIFFQPIKVEGGELTLRIRQSDGLIKRIIVDDQETVSSVSTRALAELDIGAPENVIFSVRDEEHSHHQMLANQTKLTDTEFVNGELISIFNSLDTNRMKRAKGSGKSVQRKSKSLDDVKREKEKMIKIKQQRANETLIARVASETERILRRVNSIGGVALLFGKSYNLRSRSSKFRQNAVDADKVSVEVVGCVEVPFLSSSSWCDMVRGQKLLVERVCKMAQEMEMTLLGCCVGCGGGATWGPEHVRVGLLLDQLVRETAPDCAPSKMMILSAVATAQEKGKRKSKQFQLEGGSLQATSLEAFQLSDQAMDIHSAGLMKEGTNTKEEKIEADASTKKKKRSKFRKGEDDQEKLDENAIQLKSPVLVGSKEVTSLDSLLLAEPLAIEMLTSKSRSGSAKDKAPLSHIFPTLLELQDPETRTTASLFLRRLLRNLKRDSSSLAPPGTHALSADVSSRLRDPHLLLYLGSFLEDSSLWALARSLASSFCDDTGSPVVFKEGVKCAVPTEVLLVLEMVSDSLQFTDADDDE